MAIYRGTGGSIVGVDQADEFIISVGQGGTGADNVTDARTNLGLGSAATKDETYFATAAQGDLADSALQSEDIGVSVQAYDAQLTDVAGLTPTDNGVIIGNGSNFVVESGSTLRSSLGLAIGTDVLAPNGSAASLTDFPTFNQNTTGTADNVTGVVAIANGGTGQTTAVAARAALLPSYATNGGKILAVKADASDVEYIEVSGTGTVTSVGMSVPTGLSVSGSPVTAAGTLAVTYASGYAIPTTAKQTEWDTAYTDRNKWDGGSTGLDAATGRTSLGLGTAATTAATDYATAAQGTKADSALQSSAIGVSIQGYDVDTTKNDVANTFTANQVVEVTDNTNAALRITQLGTGNALLVEDSSNPDSTPFVIDTVGNTIIGATATQNTKVSATVVAPKFQLNGTSVASSSIGQFGWNTNPYCVFSKSASATIGTYSAVGSGVFLGATVFAGDDGTQFTNASRIDGWTDAAVSTGVVPGRITFSTADSAGTMTERMRIDSSGNVGIGSAGSSTRRFTSYANASGDPLSLGYFAASSSATGGSAAGVDIIASSNKITFQGGGGDSLGFQTNGSSTDAITLETGGGLSISRTAVTSPAAGDGNVFSGTYTPTLTNTTNVAASTAYECQYMRVGNVVTVSGRVNIDATTSPTNTTLGVSLPIASNFTTTGNAGGTFAPSASTASASGAIFADSTNDRVSFRILIDISAATDYYFSFTYKVI